MRCFYTDRSSRIILGIIWLGLAAASSLLVLIDLSALSNLDIASALAVIAGCIFAWLYHATLVVVIAPNLIEVRRFWRPVWRSPLDQAHAHIGSAGDAGTHTALILSAPDRRHFALLKTLFGKTALAEIAEMLGCSDEIPGTVC